MHDAKLQLVNFLIAEVWKTTFLFIFQLLLSVSSSLTLLGRDFYLQC